VLAGVPEAAGATVPPAALVTSTGPATYRGRQAADVVPGANVALHRDAVLALGGYDERLGAGTRFASADDNDIGFRLLDAGFEVRHVPDAVVFHRAWRARDERVRMRWNYGRGKGAFYAKHMSRSDRYMLRRLLADTRTRIRLGLGNLRSSPATSASQAVYLAGMLSGVLEWLVRERRRATP
jgi:GT2 family glycosyltransferase